MAVVDAGGLGNGGVEFFRGDLSGKETEGVAETAGVENRADLADDLCRRLCGLEFGREFPLR